MEGKHEQTVSPSMVWWGRSPSTKLVTISSLFRFPTYPPHPICFLVRILNQHVLSQIPILHKRWCQPCDHDFFFPFEKSALLVVINEVWILVKCIKVHSVNCQPLDYHSTCNCDHDLKKKWSFFFPFKIGLHMVWV